MSDTIAEGMKTAKHRKSATRQITKKKSVRKQKKQQKRNHHTKRRTRRHRGGDYSIPTTDTYETTPVSSTAVISIPGKPIVSVKEEKNPQSTEEMLGLSTEDV